MKEITKNSKYLEIRSNLEELKLISNILNSSSENIKYAQNFKKILDKCIAMKEISKRKGFIKIMIKKHTDLKTRKGKGTINSKDFIEKYFCIKARELHKYLLKNLVDRKRKVVAAKVVFLYINKISVNSIHIELGISRQTVINFLNNWVEEGFESFYKKNRIVGITQQEKTERSMISKVDTRKARAILEWKQGKAVQDIANKFSVNRKTISRWITKYKQNGTISLKNSVKRRTILSEDDIPIIKEVRGQRYYRFKFTYSKISEQVGKKFTEKTLKNFLKKYNL